MIRYILAALALAWSGLRLHGLEERRGLEGLSSAAPNTPVVLVEEPSGGRLSPGLYYLPGARKFVLFGGQHSSKEPHYDVEHFDLTSGAWTNAYPKGAPYKAVSGATDAPMHSHTRDGWFPLTDEHGVNRIPLAPGYYGHSSVLMHHLYTLDTKGGQLFALIHNRMAAFDLAASTWLFPDTSETKLEQNLKELTAWSIRGFEGAGCFMKHEVLHWGALCFDPVNGEVVCTGGNAVEKGGTPGTWIWSLAEKTWRKPEFGTPELKALQEQIVALRDRSWALLSHARSRFFLTESPGEAEANLAEDCAKLKTELEHWVKEAKEAKLPAIFDAGRHDSVQKVAKYVAQLDRIKAGLAGSFDAEFLLAFRDAHRLLEQAVFGLDDQPSGRAHAQAVYDPAARKIVLFGGEGMDRTLGDTWVYDCASRTWEQRFPDLAPSPSAAHALVWLPKAGKIALVGGYNKTGHRPFEVWSYETARNAWSLHKSVKPHPGTREWASWKGLNVPEGYRNLGVVAAVNDDDVMLMVENQRERRTTWAMKIAVSETLEDAATAGAEAGHMIFSKEGPGYDGGNSYRGPAYFEKKAEIAPDKMRDFFKSLPVNTWVALPDPPVGPPIRDYGTTRLDPQRKQFLLWGGGHVNYWGTEVSHYSLRSGCWTAGEVPDEPLEPCYGMALKMGMSFRHRPHIPSHAYQGYDYDYTTGLMLVCKGAKTYCYDVAARRWLYPPLDGGIGGIRATPKGALGARDGSLVRFDRPQWKWIPYPVNGELKPPDVDRDYSGFCYDEKRDVVWYFHRNGVRRFSLQSGETTWVAKKIAVEGYLREMLYIPELDRILFHNRNKPDYDRHVLWNPETLVWEETNLPLVSADGKTPPEKPVMFSTGQGLMRDPQDGMIYVGGAGRTNYALKLDPQTLSFREIKE